MPQDLIETMPFEYQITESENGRFKVEGVFQRSDVENNNKRVYPRRIWEKELNDPRIVESIKNRAMFGHLDHPSDGKTSLAKSSHIVTNLCLEDDGTVTGSAEILNTPNGSILKALFEAGAQVGISSRGSGSVNNGIVGEDFKLSTFDFVARPSTPGALPSPTDSKSPQRYRREDSEFTSDTFEGFGEEGNVDKELENILASLPLDDDFDFDTDVVSEISERAITLNNLVKKSGYLSEELLDEAVDELNVLSSATFELLKESPNDYVLNTINKKLNHTKKILFREEAIEEETVEDIMDRSDWIRGRLEEAAEGYDDQIAEEAAMLEDELDQMSDEELIACGIEAGVIDPEELELEEGEDAEDSEEMELLDNEDVVAYIAALEECLEEAAEYLAEMYEQLEEGDNELGVKYEAALVLLEEAITRHNMLQEAVGGEDRANKLVESYISKVEKEMTNDSEYASGEEDAVVEDIEELLHSYDTSTYDASMNRNLQLAEGALKRLGYETLTEAN